MSHIFRVIAAMAAEIFSLIPVTSPPWYAALAIAGPVLRSWSVTCAMLISYVNNRYLEKVYQQFTRRLCLLYYFASEKKDNQESGAAFKRRLTCAGAA